MEEVWKDINLASLHDHPSSSRGDSLTITNSRGMSLQDFLARPFDKDPLPISVVISSGYASRVPPSTAMFTLNSGHHDHDHFHFSRQNHHLLRLQPFSSSNVCSLDLPSDAFGSSSSSSPRGKKRSQDIDSNSYDDRRRKRIIKNRESAARSRARKQAYTNELELELAHLMEENARLKGQQSRLAASAQLPKKHTLQRSLTAPF